MGDGPGLQVEMGLSGSGKLMTTWAIAWHFSSLTGHGLVSRKTNTPRLCGIWRLWVLEWCFPWKMHLTLKG